jgi:hypothetical protein
MSRRKERAKETHFHCTAEWHLIDLGATAMAVYNLAYRVSKASGIFSGSQIQVGTYYGRRRQSIGEALDQLEKLGFVVKLSSGKYDGESNTYSVVDHREWAKRHAGQCCEKSELPWGHVQLGKQLYAASGCRVKFGDFQITNYKNTGLSDEAIVAHWREFTERNREFHRINDDDFSDKKWRKSAPFYFWEHLQMVCDPDSQVSNSVKGTAFGGISGDLVASSGNTPSKVYGGADT